MYIFLFPGYLTTPCCVLTLFLGTHCSPFLGCVGLIRWWQVQEQLSMGRQYLGRSCWWEKNYGLEKTGWEAVVDGVRACGSDVGEGPAGRCVSRGRGNATGKETLLSKSESGLVCNQIGLLKFHGSLSVVTSAGAGSGHCWPRGTARSCTSQRPTRAEVLFPGELLA